MFAAKITLKTFGMVSILGALPVQGSPLTETETNFVRQRAGCFDVTYRFFDPAVSQSDMIASAKEYIDIEWVSDTHAVLQHVSIGPDPDNPEGAADEVAIHWREEWSRENSALWDYEGQLKWAKGQRQPKENELVYSVFQIDGSLRAQYPASISLQEGAMVFKGEAMAPLPRRETKAARPEDKKYDVMKRFMTIVAQPETGYEELLLATKLKAGISIGQEVGSTRFDRIADGECQKAAELWKEQKGFWQQVREGWNKVYAKNSAVKLKGYRQIGTLMTLAETAKTDSKALEQIDPIIQSSIVVTP